MTTLKTRFATFALTAVASIAAAAQPGGRAPLGDGPWEFTTYEQGGTPVRLTVVAAGLRNPWSMVWLPEGGLLITEIRGQLRMLRNGLLDPEPLSGLETLPIDKLFDIPLHPHFDDNRLVYLTYIKRAPHPDGSDAYWATTALVRGRLTAGSLADVEEIFEAAAWRELSGGDGSRIVFAPDGTLTVGRIPGTGRLERIVFADNGGEIRRESMFGELHQRIRDVREGPDGLLYLLTDEPAGALLVIEPGN